MKNIIPGKELTIDERKQLSLEILNEIDLFCKNNNIRYYLHAGTLLGAVRHNGFIPWDDDLDICMPRPDYERFYDLFKIDGLKISSFRKDKIRVLPFLKVYSEKTTGTSLKLYDLPFGLGIDIFPIDGYPENNKQKQKYFKKQCFIFHKFYILSKSCEYNQLESRSKILLLIKYILKYSFFLIFKSSFFCKIIDTRAKKNNFNNSSLAGCSVGVYRKKLEEVPRECFEKNSELLFEGRKYPVPYNYDLVLESLYGPDYMTPPPVDKQKSEHFERYFYNN